MGDCIFVSYKLAYLTDSFQNLLWGGCKSLACSIWVMMSSSNKISFSNSFPNCVLLTSWPYSNATVRSSNTVLSKNNKKIILQVYSHRGKFSSFTSKVDISSGSVQCHAFSSNCCFNFNPQVLLCCVFIFNSSYFLILPANSFLAQKKHKDRKDRSQIATL